MFFHCIFANKLDLIRATSIINMVLKKGIKESLNPNSHCLSIILNVEKGTKKPNTLTILCENHNSEKNEIDEKYLKRKKKRFSQKNALWKKYLCQ